MHAGENATRLLPCAYQPLSLTNGLVDCSNIGVDDLREVASETTQPRHDLNGSSSHCWSVCFSKPVGLTWDSAAALSAISFRDASHSIRGSTD
jgi:hypothetical protein